MNEQPELKVPEPKIDSLAEVKAKLTDKEKEDFFKAFLADKPYVAEETIFKGKVAIKFTTLSVAENNTVMLQMEYDRESGSAKATDKYLIQVIQYRLAASLVEVDHKPFGKECTENEYPNDDKEKTTYLLKRLAILKDWPIYKISSITEAFNRFEKKVRALTEESFTQDF